MRKHSVLIADDEELTRQRIRNLVEEYPHYHVVAEASTGQEALDLIQAHHPDIILLDISMPTLSGLKVLEEVDKSHYRILVFITAHERFALQAFENEALDYLLKPFGVIRFSKLMLRIDKQLQLLEPHDRTFITAKYQGINQRIDLDSILFIKANDNYIDLYTNRDSFRKRGSISSILNYLNENFIRIHRSTIVNKNEVRNLSHLTQGDYVVQMSNGKKLTSSKSYRKQVVTLLK